VRTITFSLLCLLGAAQVFVGVLWGPLRIYAQEAPFFHAIGFSATSSEQTRAFNHYIDTFKSQWSIVAWFGIATIILAALLFLATRPSIVSPLATNDAQQSNVA